MKIRIKGNTIRYRLDKIDIEHLKNSGYCEESIQIMDNTLSFIVKIHQNSANTIDFKSNIVELSLTNLASAQLFDEEKEGIQHSFRHKEGAPLHLTIERDFKCLVPRGDDDQHGFTHPQEGKTSC